MSPRCHRSRLVHTSSSNSSTTTPNHVALWLGLTSGLFQFGIRFNGMYRDGKSAVNGQSKRADLMAVGLDWRSDRIRLSADLYTNTDHVSGLNRGIALAPGIDVPEPPKPNTLLAPDWTFANTKDKAAVLHAEFDISDNVMAYANYGRSKTDFDALASSTYTVFTHQGDYRNNVSHQRQILKKRPRMWESVPHLKPV